jgi:hypothetical protein
MCNLCNFVHIFPKLGASQDEELVWRKASKKLKKSTVGKRENEGNGANVANQAYFNWRDLGKGTSFF